MPWLQEGGQVRLAGSASMDALPTNPNLGNMVSYEGDMDIGNKLNNILEITGILNNVFRPQKKTLQKAPIKLYNTQPFRFCYMAAKLGLLKQVTPEE